MEKYIYNGFSNFSRVIDSTVVVKLADDALKYNTFFYVFFWRQFLYSYNKI